MFFESILSGDIAKGFLESEPPRELFWKIVGELGGYRVPEKSKLSEEEVNQLTIEHTGWAESIARSVARAWNLDWQMDGLDGAALEAVFFCARRYDPTRGIPFKGYARKRIHEASCEAARKSKGWSKAGSSSKIQNQAREISMELVDIFPELRDGCLPGLDGGFDDNPEAGKHAVRQLLTGASLLAGKHGTSSGSLDDALDLKRTLGFVLQLEVVHQLILWKVYWEGESLRTVASDWETDELNVIREHKVLLEYLEKSIAKGKANDPPRIRPGLKDIALLLKRKMKESPFEEYLRTG